MNGQLLVIIYNFYLSIFSNSVGKSFGLVNGSFFKALMGDNNFFVDFYNAVTESGSLPDSYVFYALIAYILTLITAGVLLVCLFKLFKWIFNLIFKLFKLN